LALFNISCVKGIKYARKGTYFTHTHTHTHTHAYTNTNVHIFTHIHVHKGKAISLQTWTGPEGSRRLRLPDFKTVGT
jgi:hypothetical protein